MKQKNRSCRNIKEMFSKIIKLFTQSLYLLIYNMAQKFRHYSKDPTNSEDTGLC
jgi:hypothetical protein